MPCPRVGVYVADDHPLFVAGVARALRSVYGFELVGMASDWVRALVDLRRLVPDVAVLGVRMSGYGGREDGGREILAAARDERWATRIVVVTAYVEEERVCELLAAGAGGCLSKEVDRRALLDAVAGAARGEMVLSPGVQTGLARELLGRVSTMRLVLSRVERDVLLLAADGIATRDIAARLQLSAPTVKAHLLAAYGKLRLTDHTATMAIGPHGPRP
jgi:two-component system nitrate/nitrite response regulator NarL